MKKKLAKRTKLVINRERLATNAVTGGLFHQTTHNFNACHSNPCSNNYDTVCGYCSGSCTVGPEYGCSIYCW